MVLWILQHQASAHLKSYFFLSLTCVPQAWFQVTEPLGKNIRIRGPWTHLGPRGTAQKSSGLLCKAFGRWRRCLATAAAKPELGELEAVRVQLLAAQPQTQFFPAVKL